MHENRQNSVPMEFYAVSVVFEWNMELKVDEGLSCCCD